MGCVDCHAKLEDPITRWYGRAHTWRQSRWRNLAAAHAKAPLVHLMLPKEHATLLVPNEGGVLEPHVPTMQALQQVTKVVWDSLAARTRVRTPLAGACEVVPLGTVHHDPTHRDLL